jgi:lipoprotein-anchoring transpeptidase ErfK/SrfK
MSRSIGRRARIAAAAALVAVLAASCGGASHKAASSSTTVPNLGVDLGPISTVAEAVNANTFVYDAASANSAKRNLANPQPPYNSPLVFLVAEQTGNWLHVYLPVRPNGSMGWVTADEVRLTQHNYRIIVELGAHRITVYKGWQVIDQEPIGVGKQETPTPGGHYYLKELLKPTNPNGAYGPYAYGLSGFSNVLSDYAGGDGVIGIHGTNDPSALGHDVSHGCIRMSNDGITRLAQVLPLGVPVDIRA